ncbi:TatD family hydrolase [Luteibacter aegosomatissinici]|uniref:TatD family hydrolase n=1 Tax=Luteibacter aegosomatissinici TaxID=2911539 RepID=UPI001FF8BE09|nr:TatD family hydrolase [Luteibacter aegosomatissinici]UPG96361.1 TatD family hydrolase [Luteibacter aegosomatissinici]
MHELVDSHAHLDDSAFDADRGDMFERAARAGVRRWIVPAIDRGNWEAIEHLSASREGVYPAYGLHPLFMANHRRDHLGELPHWLDGHGAVAVGEIGLDFYVDGLDPDEQRDLFVRQLHIAKEHDLPVIVHARRAFEETIHTLRRIGGLRGVVHSFSGSEEQARQLFELGFHIGIGGPVTYDRANRIHRVVRQMPLEWLLLETDSPDQPCMHHRGERNEPAYMVDVLETIAILRESDPGEVAKVTTANAATLFGLA